MIPDIVPDQQGRETLSKGDFLHPERIMLTKADFLNPTPASLLKLQLSSTANVINTAGANTSDISISNSEPNPQTKDQINK